MQIRKKLKSVPEAIRSVRIKENAEKKKKFPVFNEIKMGIHFSFRNKEREADEKSASRPIHPACF